MKRASWKYWIAAATALCLATSFAVAAPKGKDPFAGTWQLDVAKSSWKGVPGFTAGKNVITVIKNEFKVSSEITTADGKVIHSEYSGATDGNDIKMTGNPSVDSLTLLRPDKYTVIRTDRRGGKVVAIGTITMEKDGKSYSGSYRGTSLDGHQYTATTVWNRVK